MKDVIETIQKNAKRTVNWNVRLRLYDAQDDHIDTVYMSAMDYYGKSRQQILNLCISRYQKEHHRKISSFTEIEA